MADLGGGCTANSGHLPRFPALCWACTSLPILLDRALFLSSSWTGEDRLAGRSQGAQGHAE